MTRAVQVIEYGRPWLYPEQEAAIFSPARISCIEASTKSGKTVGCIVWILEHAVRASPGQGLWWVAPVYIQAEIAFRRTVRAVRAGLPPHTYKINESDLTIALNGAGTLWFKSGERPDRLYGEDVYAVVVDEASRLREEAWHAVRSTLTATRGQVRLIGNVKGRKNWFWRLARRAEAGEKGLDYHRITWREAVAAGILDEEEIGEAARDLPDVVFRELYDAVAADDEANPFGLEAIAACAADLSGGEPACWGWDLAKKRDWTVGIALDAEGRACRFERFQTDWGQTKRRILEATGEAFALVDSTGIGDAIVEDLRRESDSIQGFVFTPRSKQQLMEGLAAWLQEHRGTYPDGPTRAELEAFEFNYTRTGGVRYAAPEGMHDDCVCSLALAVTARGQASRDDEWGFR
jgi:hypothetical protein